MLPSLAFTCYASGDLHYLTFSEHRHSWQGLCAASEFRLTGEVSALTGFEIQVKNAPVGADGVTATESVAVRLPGSNTAGGDVITLGRGGDAAFNGGNMPSLPYADSNGNTIELMKS